MHITKSTIIATSSKAIQLRLCSALVVLQIQASVRISTSTTSVIPITTTTVSTITIANLNRIHIMANWITITMSTVNTCLLYTSDAADE